MKLRSLMTTLLCAILVFLWSGGVIAHVFLGGPPAHVSWTAPLFLVVAGAIIFLSAESNMLPRLAAAGAIGLIAEIAGVHTGVPFGHYKYTSALYPQLFEVPLVMSCAWVILAAFAQQIVAPLGLPRPFRIAAFATLLTAFDLVIDPVAAGPLAYWTWQHSGFYYGIPASNFFGWWMVSACIALMVNSMAGRNPQHRFTGYVVASFFTVLAAANGMILASLIGIVFLLLPAALHRLFGVATFGKLTEAGSHAVALHELADTTAQTTRNWEEINANQWEGEDARRAVKIVRD